MTGEPVSAEGDEPLCYRAVNRPLLARIPAHASTVLDVGCGTGALGSALKARQACSVTGITHSEDEAELARSRLDRVVQTDLNGIDVSDLGEYQCIVCSHVLEHLLRPGDLLRKLHPHLEPMGLLLVALPNVLYWRQRVQFLGGRFRYTDGGLMDRTHYRFFDWQTARELVASTGYSIERAWAHGGFPLSRFAGSFGSWLDRRATMLLPGLFGGQFIIEAHPGTP
jgi:SAM-dependent methyltransferase